MDIFYPSPITVCDSVDDYKPSVRFASPDPKLGDNREVNALQK